MTVHPLVLALSAVVGVGCGNGGGTPSTPSEADDGGTDCGADAMPYWSEPGCDRPPSGCVDPTVPVEDSCPAIYEVCACDGTVLQKSGGGTRKPFLPLGTGTCH